MRIAAPAGRAAPCRAVLPEPAPIRWIEPADDRSRGGNARWCAAVGPVLFEPSPGERWPHADDALDRIAVVTWNAHEGGGRVDDLLDRLARGELTDGPVAAVVLLLQETYRRGDEVPPLPRGAPSPRSIGRTEPHRAPDVRATAARRGLAVLYAPAMRNGRTDEDREDRGNAILSTLPLGDPAVVELPLERQRRVAVSAVVSGRNGNGDPWTLRLVDAHLDTAIAWTHGGPLSARRRQAEALVAAFADADGETILGGDFNTWLGDGEPAVAMLRRAFPDAAPAPDGATWRGPFGVHATLDRVFARGSRAAVRVRRLDNRLGSDHYPMIAIVSF